jgi:hypothetical protein
MNIAIGLMSSARDHFMCSISIPSFHSSSTTTPRHELTSPTPHLPQGRDLSALGRTGWEPGRTLSRSGN